MGPSSTQTRFRTSQVANTLNTMRRRFFEFGVAERERWIEAQASSLPAGSRVLDVGAGPCQYRPLFKHCDYRTQDYCQHEASSHGPFAESWHYGALDYVSDATAIPVDDGSFDAVICTEVLEHVLEPALVLQEISRILRDGGRLILSAPLGSGLHQEPDHYYGGFTPYWYQHHLHRLGFDHIDVVPNGGFFKHYGQESQRFSALIDPRRLPGKWRAVLAPAWLLTVPWFRLVLPITCHFLDRLDVHKAFTVGYHVTAVRHC